MTQSPKSDESRFPSTPIEIMLRTTARTFLYPETPDIAARERQRIQSITNGSLSIKGKRTDSIPPVFDKSQPGRKRRLVYAFVVAAAIVTGLLLVTPVRARLIDWLRIGAVRIFLNQPKLPPGSAQPSTLVGLVGETTLVKVMDEASFQLFLPSYPPDLGDPQWVYLQKINETPVVIFVWQEPQAKETTRLALYQIGMGNVFQKELWKDLQETTVNGHWALWVEGPYLLLTNDGRTEQRRVVQGRTLIWVENEVTYRLETSLPLDEARKIAESLKPLERK